MLGAHPQAIDFSSSSTGLLLPIRAASAQQKHTRVGRAARDDLPSGIAAFRAKAHDPVSGLDHLRVR
jgi:hypothetical protein